MASLQELRGLFGDSDLTEKVEAAVVIAANEVLAGTPTTEQKVWAATVFRNPNQEAKKAMMAVLATNSSATVAQIQAANDTAIQSAVNNVVSVLVDALAAGV